MSNIYSNNNFINKTKPTNSGLVILDKGLNRKKDLELIYVFVFVITVVHLVKTHYDYRSLGLNDIDILLIVEQYNSKDPIQPTALDSILYEDKEKQKMRIYEIPLYYK